MKVQMTGIEDRQGPWKVAIVGFPGVGKTLFASTASNPLFVFFQENPRLKSIADRAVPHLKLANDFSDGGASTLDKLQALVMHLQLSGMDESAAYQTLVIDTGDELYQSMKSARSYQNGGEFGPGDWNWIADAYREVMGTLIDLPMDVIVIYHVKSTMDEGVTSRELMLQGASKDEAAGWFDIVGALDTFEVTLDDGTSVTKRALMTHSSRTYPWVKDHSGAIPRRFELSEGIVDDFPRLMTLVKAVPEIAVAHEELEEIVVPEEEARQGTQVVPTPEELHAKKDEQMVPATTESPPPAAPIPSQDSETNSPRVDEGLTSGDVQEDAPESREQGELANQKQEAVTSQEPVQQALPPEGDVQAVTEESIPSQDSAESGVTEPDSPTASQEQPESPKTLDAAAALVTEELGGEEVSQTFNCDQCGDPVEDKDLADLTQIRFRKYLCREHFKDALAELKRSKNEANVG